MDVRCGTQIRLVLLNEQFGRAAINMRGRRQSLLGKT